jgi:hypothetical protein
MIITILLYVGLSFAAIFGINYFNLAQIDYTFVNILITFVSLVLLRVLYTVFIKFMKVFLFAVVFLPLVGLFGYYIYSYVTGQPIEMIQWPF